MRIVNHRPPRPRRAGRMLAAGLAAAGLLVTTAPVAEAAPERRLHPARVERTGDVGVLHMRAHTVVDPAKDRRIRVPGFERTGLLGRHQDAYVVLAGDDSLENWQLLRVAADGSMQRLRGGTRFAPVMLVSEDGSHVASSTYDRSDRLRVRVIDSRTGEVVRQRSFPGSATVVAYGPRRLVISNWRGRGGSTSWWNPHNNEQKPIVAAPAGLVDVGADRLTYYDGDPFQGGCQIVTRLSRPRERVWRSCEDRVFAFSPRGKRMVTAHILSDGLGPREVRLRGGQGRLLATYRARWFGFLEFENDRRLLLETVGKQYVAVLECTPRGCARVSRLHRHSSNDPFIGMDWSFPQ